MTTAQERLRQWLRDAHAMEEQAKTMLGATAARLEHYPELKARLESHQTETTHQAQMVGDCLARLGGGTSSIKDATAKMVAVAQGLSGLFVGDVVKASMAAYTFEHMEISAYRILIAAAEQAGDAHTQQVCGAILREEEAMAQWLSDHLASITQRYLVRDAQPGVVAKY